jgi:hypothetical protein
MQRPDIPCLLGEAQQRGCMIRLYDVTYSRIMSAARAFCTSPRAGDAALAGAHRRCHDACFSGIFLWFRREETLAK